MCIDKDHDLDSFLRKKDRKTENVAFQVLHQLKAMPCVKSKIIIAQLNNKQSRIIPFVDRIRT